MPKQQLMRVLLCLALICLSGLTVNAQETDEFTPYDWYTANLWLSYPAAWEFPLETSQPGRLTLILKPHFDDTQDPQFTATDTPAITLTRLSNVGSTQADLRLRLSEAFQAEGIVPTDFVPIELLLNTGLQVQGISLDGQYFALGQAVNLEGDILMVVGLGPVNQQGTITEILNRLFVDSIAMMGWEDAAFSPGDEAALSYGVLWHSANLHHEGQVLMDLSGLASGPDGSLYSFERYRGLAHFDGESGELLSFSPNEDILDTFSLAVNTGGQVYVADPLCLCIMLKAEGDTWFRILEDVFHAGSPVYIAIDKDDTLYATNHSPQGQISIYALQGEQVLNSYTLPETVTDQPLLAVYEGALYVLTNENEVLILQNGTLEVVFSLAGVTRDLVIDFAPLGEGLFAIITASEGVLVVAERGEVIARPGRLVPGFPLPGEFVWPTGISAAPDGTLYIVDSGGNASTLTAFSTNALPDRIGDENLQLDQPVQGTLDRLASQQTWTYAGTAEQEITLSAVDLGGLGEVDVALRLLAPDGVELAYNDNHEGGSLFGLNDAQIANFVLPTNGHYIIVVEHRSGEGTYGLGITETRAFNLSPEGITLEGWLSDSVPVQRWTLDAAAGQALTITLTAKFESLDPLVRVTGPTGMIIAENDNAEDMSLGLNAQIVNLTLPETGRYVIEASRFDGNGDYVLEVLPSNTP